MINYYYIKDNKFVNSDVNKPLLDLKKGDVRITVFHVTGFISIFVVESEFTANTDFKWRSATDEEKALAKTHLLLNT